MMMLDYQALKLSGLGEGAVLVTLQHKEYK
jgi:hypothetical protein